MVHEQACRAQLQLNSIPFHSHDCPALGPLVETPDLLVQRSAAGCPNTPSSGDFNRLSIRASALGILLLDASARTSSLSDSCMSF